MKSLIESVRAMYQPQPEQMNESMIEAAKDIMKRRDSHAEHLGSSGTEHAFHSTANSGSDENVYHVFSHMTGKHNTIALQHSEGPTSVKSLSKNTSPAMAKMILKHHNSTLGEATMMQDDGKMDMKSISQKLQDDIRAIMEAGLHPNQQKIDVHEPEKDEITAHDFKKLRDMKKGKSKEDMQKDEAMHGMKKKHTMQELSGKAAQQAAVAISLIKAGKKDGKMPKPMKEDSELDEARKLEGTYSHSNGNQSKVYKLSGEHNEGDPYHVKLFKGGKHYEPADYFTNDKEDAHATAKSMVKEESELTELSKSTLGSYVKQSSRDSRITRKIAADFENRADRAKSPGMKAANNELSSKYKSKSLQRQAGLEKAVDRLTKEEVEEEQIDETIVKHNSFTVDIKDSYSFGDYLSAAKQLVGEEEAVNYANDAFKVQDLTIFMMEEMSRGDIESNINAHRKAGHTVSMPKYSTKDGKPHAEYTVTDKDEGTRRKYIHHGNVRKVENMGAKGQ